MGFAKADDLRRLWKGTGISRKRKLELMDSLVGTKITYALETLNTTTTEETRIKNAQTRL